MDFWTQLEEVQNKWNVLEHPFYQRWSDGELTVDELATYSGQYRHAVVALADASDATVDSAEQGLRKGLAKHAAEERSHVALWDRFVGAVGGDSDAEPNTETAACATVWAGDGQRSMLGNLVTMYAIESAQPQIAKTKRDGLVERYGFATGPATEYFDLHAELDIEHAAAERALIEPRLEGADHDALLKNAEDALKANWELLDGVERMLGREPAVAA